MTYEEFINNILNTRGRFSCGEEYHERHHIVPKCMGGSNDTENLIDLFAREHFEAHRLLALENPDNEGLAFAWGCMAWRHNERNDKVNISPEEYEEAKIAVAEAARKIAKERLMYPENNPMYGKHHSDETKEKIRKMSKGRPSPNKGKNLPEDQKKRLSDLAKTRKHSEETKRKISEANKKRTVSADTRKKLSDSRKGKKLSEETKIKISKAKQGTTAHNKGKPMSEEQKKKLSESKKGKYTRAESAKAKIVVQFQKDMTPVKIWACQKDAADNLNICSSSISHCCVKKRKTAGGFVWNYLYDTEYRDGQIIPGAITLGLIEESNILEYMLSKHIT